MSKSNKTQQSVSMKMQDESSAKGFQAGSMKSGKQFSYDEKQISPYYLEHIKVTSFGKFANLIIGPFKPGLNVVYGPNEAGKTTINELAKAVLFGWPAARGNTNAYKPENADRAGSLFFKNKNTGEVEELKRLRNIESPDENSIILGDIDKTTHDTMFALTSDELMRLDKHNDITAHLLTAGSGTLSSPAAALDEINARIKEMLSRSVNNPNSITNLKAEQAKARIDLQNALEKMEYYRAQELKLKDLQPRKETLEKTQTLLNEEIEHLQVQLSKLQSIDESIEQTEKKLIKTQEAEHLAQVSHEAETNDEIRILSNLSQKDEFRLRDTLEDLDETRIKLNNAVDHAQETLDKSTASLNVIIEDTVAWKQEAQQKRINALKLGFSIFVPIALIGIGAYLLYLATKIGGLSLYLMGSFLILAGIMVAVAGVAMNIRSSKTGSEKMEEQQSKANWVIQQDQKVLDRAKQAAQNHAIRVQEFLDNNNMTQAHGSLRRARYMLDQARDFRANVQSVKQNRQALALQEASLESTLARSKKQRAELCLSVGLPPSADVYELEQIILRKKAERDKTMQLTNETNTQVGEINQELQSALVNESFTKAKFKKEMIDTRIKEANKKLATLFLAQRTLETAISDWEKKSQPEVYKQASRIFELMTNGAWKQVRMNSAGEIEVVDAVKSAFSPTVLSLGTRQQLYLSLRIALLMTANNVGRSLPIMCDDILVNFDRKRQANAVLALQELAQVRQVIMFTCHEEIVELVLKENSATNLIEL